MKHFLAAKTRAFFLGSALCVAGAAVFSGCRAPEQQARDDARRVVEESKGAVERRKNALGEGVVTTKNSTLQGNDAQGKLLWRLSFAQGTLSSGGGKNALGAAPQKGDLTGANATLFRNGRAESSFKAKKISFVSTPRGLMMTMSGGVHVQTVAAKTLTPNISTTSASTSKKATSSTRAALPISISAPTVNVDVKARTMRAAGGVRMTQGQTVVTAPQLAADSGLTTARASGGVLGVAPQGRIRAQNAVWNWTNGRVEASGGVEVSSAKSGTKISGTNLQADTRASRGVVSGKVRAVSGDGGKASAGQVRFNWTEKTISARDDVTLQKDGATLRASLIESDSDLNRARASGGVVLTRDDATISASELRAYDRATRVVASGDVRVRRSDGTLRAARAEVWIGEKRAVASGEVTIERRGATLRAANAQYWSQDGRAVASGGVTISRDGATLRADRAQYGMKSGRATANGDVRLVRDDVTVTAARVESANIGDAKGARLFASGGVTARGKGGEIRAQSVTWGDGKAIANGDVRLERGGNVVRGARLTSDQSFARAVLAGDVSGTLGNGAHFTSSTLIWTRMRNGKALARGGKIVAQNGVVVRQNALTLRGARFEANGDGSEAFLSGGVSASDGKGAQVRSDNARYDAANGKIIARGNVFYRDASGNTLRGSNLVARVVDGSLKDATLNNVTGTGTAKLFSGNTLFGN